MTEIQYDYNPAIIAQNEFLESIKEFGEEDKLVLENALAFAIKKHKDQWYDWKNNSKTPYTYHILKVAVNVQKFNRTPVAIISALWHDLLEDTNVTIEEISEFLKKHTLPPQTIDVLQSLNRKNFNTPAEYYEKIFQNELAFSVKTADLLANLEASYNRINEMLSNETRFWFYRYLAEIKYLIFPKFSEKNSLPFEELNKISFQIITQLNSSQIEELQEFSQKYLADKKLFEGW
jgi:(p)ppGpp synthase/HD superfamily hydrolase